MVDKPFSESESQRAPWKVSEQLLLTAAALTSGAALVVAIKVRINLGLTLVCLGAMAGTTFRLRWLKSDSERRRDIKARTRTGLVAGALATLGYDLSRLLIVTAAQMTFWPFHAFPQFGLLIIGQAASLWAAWTVGTIYHYVNGIAFAIGYCYLFGGRNWKWGIAWGLGLEAAMFTIYPGWLNLDAVMAEFTMVSVSGHVVYGSILGVVAMQQHHGKMTRAS
jgi:hypothetical protein